ncbi:MAG: 30S ribosomal protein S5 [Candidatus Nanoarchaeia archaeon]|jgi:small subunit ribosomal protein S5|nr:30S ribosomal protein S5 [Candidatus Nanoarchaeia archaeon]|tara:strand:- start:10335 stop:11111 length:777 start_codon:yes stop_codon:yes gene_type:complete
MPEEIVKEVVEETKVVEEVKEKEVESQPTILDSWNPKTDLGKKVKSGEIKDIDYILDNGLKIMELEIVDYLLPNIESTLILLGQSKGKFGGGKRSVWRQTQKKTKEGNKPKFSSLVAVGNKDGYVGIGIGKARETVPAREKAIRNAKLNLIKIKRGSGSWESEAAEHNSIPCKVEGKVGSSRIVLMSAPKGTGLVIEKECAKLLELAGIKDVYSKTYGQTKTKLNLMNACFNALKKLSKIKMNGKFIDKSGVISGHAK